MAEELEDLVEHTLVRTQETENHERNYSNRSWEAIRDECIAGDALDARCNVVAASLGKGHLEVVSQRLICGCILVPAEGDEAVL